MKNTILEELRGELGGIADMVDTIIYMEQTDEGIHCSKDGDYHTAVKAVTDNMVKTWNECLENEKNKKLVTEIYLDSLIETFIEIVDKVIVPEDRSMVFENVFRLLRARL